MVGVAFAAGAPGAAPITAGRAVGPGSVNHPVRGLSTNAGKSTSLDWAGYAVTGAGLKTISGGWREPAVTCPVNQVQQSSFWLGIDGFSAGDPTVQQIGTDSDCTRAAGHTSGTPNYYAWYEMYPQKVFTLSKTNYPVAPGDNMIARVSHVGSTYTLSISNVNRWTFNTTQVARTPPLNSSAEWITEAPCSGSPCTILPLADFKVVPFSSSLVDGGTITTSGLAWHQITMTTSTGIAKAVPSALNPTGAAFMVTWKHH